MGMNERWMQAEHDEVFCPHCGKKMVVSEDLIHEKYLFHTECGNQFSNPHYVRGGSGDWQSPGSGKILRGIFIVFCIIFFWGFIGSEECSSSGQNEEVVCNSGFDASVWQVENYLKKEYLFDPRSYEGIEWSAVNKKDNGGYWVRHKYRAKNGFGGYVIENKVFHLDASGKVIGVDDVSLYEDLVW